MAACGWTEVRAKQRVLFLLCTEDYNSAFYPKLMDPIFSKIKMHSRVAFKRIYTIGQLYSTLKRYKNTYETLCIAGHGCGNAITISKRVVIRDETYFRGRLGEKCRKIVCLSCCTGRFRDGVAYRLARLGRDVLAPRNIVYLDSIDVNPSYGARSAAFPINFEKGRLFSRKGVSDYTGYSDVSEVDLPLYMRGAPLKEVCFRIHRFQAVKRGDLAAKLLFSLLPKLPVDPEYHKRYIEKLFLRCVSELSEKKKHAELHALCTRFFTHAYPSLSDGIIATFEKGKISKK